MKYFIGCFTILLFAVACRPMKKIQKIDQAVSKKKDTTQTIIVTKQPEAVDSAKMAKQTLIKIGSNKIDFNTFQAKIKVQYEGAESSDQATANVRIKKDSLIWVMLTGPLGIEGMRMLISKDSVVLMNKLKKTVQYRTIDYLKESTEIPFDFATLQDLLIGNPIFLDSNVVSYKYTDKELTVLTISKLFKQLITLSNENNAISHVKLDDTDPMRNRTCDISYSQYENKMGFPFATYRHISVSEKSKLDVYMDFKTYSVNEPVTFPFNVPKSYKVK